MPPPDDAQSGRRAFFRKLLLSGLDEVERRGKSLAERVNQALEKTAEETDHAAAQTRAAEGNPGAAPEPEDDYQPQPLHLPQLTPERWLRPPGALRGELLAQTCSREGACVRACPAQCIVIDPGVADGLPHIVARRSPCVVCTDLSCMKVCPTGALALLPEAQMIRMGLARTDPHACLRGHRNEDCRICIEKCPLGEQALGLDAEGRIEVRPGCIGCGICEHYCPTEPASIWVE